MGYTFTKDKVEEQFLKAVEKIENAEDVACSHSEQESIDRDDAIKALVSFGMAVGVNGLRLIEEKKDADQREVQRILEKNRS